ncbi:hypothetical protein BCV71DRAFT_240214, partial [Rhizopus microsporus]
LVEGVSESALVLSAVSLPLIVSVFPRLSLFNDAVLKNLKNEFPQSKSSKRKDDIETKKKKPFQKDTTSYQIIKFVQAVMNVLDKHSLQKKFIVSHLNYNELLQSSHFKNQNRNHQNINLRFIRVLLSLNGVALTMYSKSNISNVATNIARRRLML